MGQRVPDHEAVLQREGTVRKKQTVLLGMPLKCPLGSSEGSFVVIWTPCQWVPVDKVPFVGEIQ